MTTSHREVTIEGRPLRYTFDQVGAGPPVICVHGITRNRHDFAFLAERLGDRFAVHAPDLLGHGDSAYLDPGTVYEKEMFLAQLDDLMASTGAARIGFVGSSYGGLMGIRLAARPGSPIAALVLNDAGVGIRQEFYEKVAQKISLAPTFGSMTSVEGWMKLVMGASGALAPETFSTLARRAVRQNDAGDYVLAYDKELPRVWLGNHNRTPEPWSLWEDIRCPVLLVRGARSKVVTAEVVAEMKARKPSMEVVEIDDAGHFPHLMSAAQTAPVERWLQANL
jgi:pimeloyl-ACP methyl ester carboxylesterase